jgi:hypothetical protein
LSASATVSPARGINDGAQSSHQRKCIFCV